MGNYAITDSVSVRYSEQVSSIRTYEKITISLVMSSMIIFRLIEYQDTEGAL